MIGRAATVLLTVAVLLPPPPLTAQQGGLEDAPRWVRTREVPEYGSEEYLLGLGSASLTDSVEGAIAEAAAESRVDIARQIATRVRESFRQRTTERRVSGTSGIENVTTQVIRQETDLRLASAEVVRQWSGQRRVYVLSALHRGESAARARSRIGELETSLWEELRRLEKLVDSDPVEAFRRWPEVRTTRRELSMQHAVLTGVTRRFHPLPDSLLEQVEELGSTIRDRLEVVLLVDRSDRDRRSAGQTSYGQIRELLQEMEWTVRTPPDSAEHLFRHGDRPGASRALRTAGIRYALVIRLRGKETDAVRLSSGNRLVYARAGGSWQLRDLEDGSIDFEATYDFPDETKTAHRSPRRARAMAIKALVRMMRADLREKLGMGEDPYTARAGPTAPGGRDVRWRKPR